jgi:hypothetical protein
MTWKHGVNDLEEVPQWVRALAPKVTPEGYVAESVEWDVERPDLFHIKFRGADGKLIARTFRQVDNETKKAEAAQRGGKGLKDAQVQDEGGEG